MNPWNASRSGTGFVSIDQGPGKVAPAGTSWRLLPAGAALADPCKPYWELFAVNLATAASWKLHQLRPIEKQYADENKMTSWREVARPLRQIRISHIPRRSTPVCARRWYSAEAAAAAPVEESPLNDLESNSTLGISGPSPEEQEEFGTPSPWKRAKDRKAQLPASRYGP